MMKNNLNFAVFILTFGRADTITTYLTIRRQGYTGKIYLICSIDDPQLNRYKELYKGEVIEFDKNEYKGTFDMADNFGKMNVVVYARNANWEIAKKLGLKYFAQFDDDYSNFQYKYITPNLLLGKTVKNLDIIFDSFIDFLDKAPKVSSIAFAQGGDFIGGIENNIFSSINRKRKLMNTFFNCVDRPYTFLGSMNDDVNNFIQNGKTGYVFLTHPRIAVIPLATQSITGGLTEDYLKYGTYVKSFYPILFNPSAVRIKTMGESHRRLHHAISWKHAMPYIIQEKYKKP